MIEIIPTTVLVRTSVEFNEIVERYEPFFTRISIDISDGIFTTVKTINGYEEIMDIKSKLNFDVHMMVENPQDKIHNWYNTKADRFFIHIEHNQHVMAQLINQIHYYKKKIGIVINPDTEVEEVREFADAVDYVQFMTVQPGAYGREFIDGVLGKIIYFKEAYPNIPIAVDGGINLETISRVTRAGASVLFIGNYFYKSKDIGKSLGELTAVINS